MTVGEDQRAQSLRARLARLGFAEPEVGAPLAARQPGDVVDALAGAADPDLALATLAQLTAAVPGLGENLLDDPVLLARLAGVLGASAALGEHLVQHPSDLRVLTSEADDPSEGELRSAVTGMSGPPAHAHLRRTYLRHLLAIAGRDVTGVASLEAVARDLADLAAATLQAALDIARVETPGSESTRLAVIAMGKCGGRELNYVSDVDVVFVCADEADIAVATRMATAIIRACAPIWPVDAALRPEGKAGPLVRTLASHVAYYERWAKTWEFQALLKARPAAGDAELGRAYVDALAPFVWSAAGREHFVTDVQAMRRRVEAHVAEPDARRELKLGPGGLRDVEFAVQLLQLVHGRADDALRSPTTLTALADLAAGGYIGRDDAEVMADAYRFLRTLEHRLQLRRLRRTHTLPTDEGELRRLGRGMGYRTDPVVELDAAWSRHARDVRRLHEKLFYRPLLASVALLPGDQARLTPDAARQRLEALGYADPVRALQHLEALSSGVSRRAAIQRTLLPVMLGWFADAADPDAGLLAFRQVSEALGTTPWYLRLLRDEGVAAQRMALLLASSRYVSQLLLRAPEAVAMLADDEQLRPRSRAALTTEVLAAVERNEDWEEAVRTARGLRRRELLRIACADVLGLLDVAQVGEALADVAAATIVGALETASREIETGWGSPLPMRLAVIAMGRLGGREQGYGSDADVLFVYEVAQGAAEGEAAQAAHAVASELRRLLAVPAPDPPLEVDADLRPEGRQGPLVRTLASYVAYYGRWSHVWESQALLRAEPLAGSMDLAQRFCAAVAELRWPDGGLTEHQVREIRRIKARVEAERLPRGADPALHTKLGRGGLADVEWTVQLLQLCHAHAVPTLRTTSTLTALGAAAEAGLLGVEDAATLATAWKLATRVRNAVVLTQGRAGDSVPTVGRELVGVARIVGYSPTQSGDFLEEYRRVTRRARAVAERVFYA